ncbi:MAG: hypothetical protein J0H40_24075 [Rhizobiales bacterium]|nr:hypothetical protein [Hyphomicrobiales bacterium]
MRLTLMHLLSRVGLCVLPFLVVPVVSPPLAHAEGAFVQQATGSYRQFLPGVAVPLNVPASMSAPSWAPKAAPTRSMPETAVPATGGNFASTLEIGNFNRVTQAQIGSGNISNVGIIKGYANNVGVLQAGSHLKSNLALINTAGLSVGVIQPNGSAPVNMLIARLPNGALLIKR